MATASPEQGFHFVHEENFRNPRASEDHILVNDPHLKLPHVRAFLDDLLSSLQACTGYLDHYNAPRRIPLTWTDMQDPNVDKVNPPKTPGRNALVEDLVGAVRDVLREIIESWRDELQKNKSAYGPPECPDDIDAYLSDGFWESRIQKAREFDAELKQRSG